MASKNLMCPCCKYVSEFDTYWLNQHDLIYCMNCTKTLESKLWNEVKDDSSWNDMMEYLNSDPEEDFNL